MATLLNISSSGRTSSDADTASSNQIVFVDSTVVDYAALLDGIAPGTQVYLLDPSSDGLQQIADVMQNESGVTAISIIAHGEEGGIRLGSTIVDSTVVSQEHAALSTIGAALAPGGDILLYGCDTGEGSDGQALVDQIASGTGANVAAASHIVGDTEDGGSWNLDVTSTGSPVVVSHVLSTTAENSYASALAINDPPSGLPINITTFTGNTSFDYSGNTSITSAGYLQLTPATTSQAGLAVYTNPFPSTTGISVQFTYYSGGGTGADGIVFFLINADTLAAAGQTAANVTAGSYGASLGYGDAYGSGITDGWLGIGFDTYGNFSNTLGNQTGNSSATANEVAVRGSGTGTSGYALLTNKVYSPGIDGTRTVKINLLKIDSTHESLSVFISSDGGKTFTEIITNYSVNQTLPTNFDLGFSASTGGSTDLHQIENLAVTLPVTLAVSTPTITYPNTTDASTLTLLPGDKFTYSYTITDTVNGSSEITLLDTAASVETGVTWTVKDDVQTQTGTGNINLSNIDLSAGDSATVTVSGTISSAATSGNASHTITTTPGAAFSYLTPSTGVVAFAIGSANPQLSGTTTTAATSGTTSVAVFSAAQVADAHSSPTETATITLTNSSGVVTDANGVLSGTGLTETSTKGIYTLTSTSLSTFNTELQALVFTPTASTTKTVTNVGLSVSDGVTGTTAATSTTAISTAPTCFLAGTHILTERGEMLVETLFAQHRAGAAQDRVAVLEAGEIVFRDIRWVGGRHLDASIVAATDGHPIRIMRHAFADNVPHRDLLVTQEHCVFVEERLIPARMLVNGRTIIEDHSIVSYSYYHIELEQHGVLVSEGLATESYLDTGNRGSFSNAEIVTLRPKHATAAPGKAAEACAPLATARALAEPIWHRLDERADRLGMAPRQQAVAPLQDPELRIVLDDGSRVSARWEDGNRHFFQLPAGRRAVRLQSRSAVPARAVGAFIDDRRRLGVQIEALVVWQGLDECRIPAAQLQGEGWHTLESAVRWTNGDALLDLPVMLRSESFIELVVADSLAYPAGQADADRLAA